MKVNIMLVFGLILTIILYVLLLAFIFFYFVLIIKKKYNLCDMLEKVLFLFALIALMVESWALVMMNNGFNFNFNIGIIVEYYFSIILIVPLVGILAYSSIIVRKNSTLELDKMSRVGNYILLPFTILAVAAATVLLFFNINYFVYYTM